MASHYLFEPNFCNPASGWEKGQVEKNVQDARRRLWQQLPSFPDIDALNVWLEEQCIAQWSEIQHGGLPGTVADVHAQEVGSLMPLGRPFDGFVEHTKRVSPVCLIHFERNRYSVPASFANRPVSVRIYPERIVVAAEGQILCVHSRIIDRSHPTVGQPQNRWTDLIGEGIATLARELADKAAPVPDLVQWFGEWAREARAEQRGLLLLTAHRAKGLEFDHVAILNGGWDRLSRNEDEDAPRRLFYVAMTRARASLTIMTDGPHPFALHGDDAILARRVMPDAAVLSRAQLRYVSPDPKLVDLSFPGRLVDGHSSLAAIDAAGPGDAVQLVRDGNRWHIEDSKGRILSRLSRAFAPPADTIFLRGQVAAVLNWRKEDGHEDYAHLLRRDAWGIVLPELVFERAG